MNRWLIAMTCAVALYIAGIGTARKFHASPETLYLVGYWIGSMAMLLALALQRQ